MTKTIEIIPLAKKKAQKRGITEAQIRETVNFPDQVVEGYGGRKVAQKKYVLLDKRFLLRVAYEENKGMCTIVTAYLTSQVRRYWRNENED